jgi:uncharacterized protein YhaN
MKIEQIDLKAYGHFTNRRLSLAGVANFHIICGPNEAGKTTLWRAINGALFGIPERSQDTFLHDTKKLRVGLQLKSAAGEQLAIMRRKGRVNTLLKYDPATGDELAESVSDDRILEWLGGLSKELFLAMFSLDHDALVRGGESLAQGKGDVGESLFEAGAGLTSIRTLRAKLDRESESLFKPRASTSLIYKALSDYDNSRKQAKEGVVRPADWTQAKTAMETAGAAYEAAKLEQSALQKESRRLERLSATLPDIAALKLAQARLTELSSVPVLPESASTDRIAATTKRDNAAETERVVQARLEERRDELAGIQYNEAILTAAESIEAIHHATTTYRESLIGFATAEGAIEDAQKAFKAALKQISTELHADEVMLWIPDATKVARIRALGTSGATLKAGHDADLKSLGEKQHEVARLEADLVELGEEGDATRLTAYLGSIADQGDPDSLAQQLDIEVKAALIKLDTDASGLKLTSADTVAATTAPIDGLVQQFKTDEDELSRQARSIRESTEKIEDDLANLQADIKGLEVRGEVPTRQSVIDVRSRRDSLWFSIRRRFMPAPGEAPSSDSPPPEQYEQAVSKADEASDGLFADAERATRYAEYRVRESQMDAALKLQSDRAKSVSTEQATLQQRWAELLLSHKIPPIAIAEAPTWITKRDTFLQKREDILVKRQEAQQKKELALQIRNRIADLFQELKAEAPASGERLSELLARARLISKEHGEQRTQRELKKSDLVTARHTLAAAEKTEAVSLKELDVWRTQWETSMQAIQLTRDASPEEATARIDQFFTLQSAHDALDSAVADRRTAQIKVDDYKQRLTETWQRVHGEAMPEAGRSPEILAGDLYRELTESRTQQQQKVTLAKQIADDQQALDEAIASADTATKSIDKLQLQGNCDTLESLELVEEKSRQRISLTDEVREIEDRLVKSSGVDLVNALTQAEGQDPNAVAEAVSDNLQKNKENAALVQKLHEDFLTARQAFDSMDGSSSAADAQQSLAQHSARITELSADYAASRIASAILAQVIDTYQKRNQGPLIDLASKRYASITNGRYSAVVIDFDEDRQILKAVRADGERLTMEELSTGRRDQLFLALRLAAIEGHLEKGEPLPIIIDDILIQFDDAAAAATFKVLADLSQRTQVLFLTHHEHLIEVAEECIGGTSYTNHILSP